MAKLTQPNIYNTFLIQTTEVEIIPVEGASY